MKNCGRLKVRKHKEIKDSEKYITLDTSENYDSLNKTETTSSESKEKLERSGKGLVTALALKTKVRPKKYKKAGYAIGNFSMIFENGVIMLHSIMLLGIMLSSIYSLIKFRAR